MNAEERIAQLLRRTADTYVPGDGREAIGRRITARRRVRVLRRAAVPLLVAVLVAAVCVPLLVGGTAKQQVVSVGPASLVPEDLLVANAGGLEWIDPSDGQVVHRLTLAQSQGKGTITWISASPDGTSAFATLEPDTTPACWVPTIVRIDLVSGTVQSVVQGSYPAVDPGGHTLAYLDIAPLGCAPPHPPQFMVRDLVSGVTRVGEVPSSVVLGQLSGGRGLSWSEDDRHLAISLSGTRSDTVLVADTAAPDPTGFGYIEDDTMAHGAAAAFRTDGTLAMATQTCAPQQFCVTGKADMHYLSVPDNGSVKSTSPDQSLPSAQVDQVLAARQGDGLAYLSGGGLYIRSSNEWRRLASDVSAAAWVVPPPTASAAPPTPGCPASEFSFSPLAPPQGGLVPGPGLANAVYAHLGAGQSVVLYQGRGQSITLTRGVANDAFSVSAFAHGPKPLDEIQVLGGATYYYPPGAGLGDGRIPFRFPAGAAGASDRCDRYQLVGTGVIEPSLMATAERFHALSPQLTTPGQSPPSSQPAVILPNVVGQQDSRAMAALAAIGLRVATETEPNPRVPAGVVFQESPTAGSSVPKGTTVTLLVS